MIKLNRWLEKPEHRIIGFLGLWVILSWLICIPEIQLGRYLLKIKTMSDLVNLSLIKDSTFVTRFIAQWLDKVPLLTNILNSIKLYEIIFFIIIILFSYKDKNYPFISFCAISILIIQLSMHAYLLIQLFRLNRFTNPNTALNLLNQIAYIYQVLGFTTLIISFMTFLVFIVKLGANSLHA